MDQKNDRISSLKKNRSNWKIIVRITRLWLALRPGITADNANLEAIGLDDKGDQIHIEIENEDVPRYKNLLTEGRIYAITNFAVKSDAKYRPVIRDIKIVFTSTTEVDEQEESVISIPLHKFEFADYQVVHDGRKREEQLFDVIGVCVSMRKSIHGQTERTIIIIQDLSGKQCTITLWGNISEDFNAQWMLTEEGTKILIVASLTVRHYIPPSCASSTSGTKIYINLDCPEVMEYLERYENQNIEQTLIPAAMGRSKIVEKTIAELLELPRDNVERDTLYVCIAKIVDFELDRNWFYYACHECNKGMKQFDQVYKCDSCKPKTTAPVPRYKIEAEVEDRTGSALFVHFGRAGDDLVGIPITALLRVENCDKRVLPSHLENLRNTTLRFGVITNSQTRIDGKASFIVLKIFKEKPILATNNTPPSTLNTEHVDIASQSSGNEVKIKSKKPKKQKVGEDDDELSLLDFQRRGGGVVIKDFNSIDENVIAGERVKAAKGKKLKQNPANFNQQTDINKKPLSTDIEEITTPVLHTPNLKRRRSIRRILATTDNSDDEKNLPLSQLLVFDTEKQNS